MYYRIAIGPMAFGPLSEYQLRDIFSNGRIAYLLVEAFVARTFTQVYQQGDGAGKDLIEYSADAQGILGIQAKGFHGEGPQETSNPDLPLIHSISAADFEIKSGDLVQEDLISYCRKFDLFLYHNLDAIERGNVEFVVIPSSLVARAVELSFCTMKKNGSGPRISSFGHVSLNFIRSNIKGEIIIDDTGRVEKETADGQGAVLHTA